MQVFTVSFNGFKGSIYSFAVKKVGQDGNGYGVYVGHYDLGNKTGMCALIMKPNGQLLAAHYDDTYLKAAEAAIKDKQKGYGGGHRDKHLNWVTYGAHGQETSGYEAD